ncbi:MAG: type I methionyl aminopeptidase [Proteobacteria bacterium]|nr:type I methionyl aminopeptidase [Pseudomonadota bacterium]
MPKNAVEIEKMRVACRLAAEVLDVVTPQVKAGVSTRALNDICLAAMVERGCTSATLGYRGYPRETCISVNDVVCHGIPSEGEILKDGDILNIDVTVIKDGFYGDTSRMFTVGSVSDAARQLIKATYDGMMAGIATVKSGSRLHEIGTAIEQVVAPRRYGIVREYCGHGVGKKFHEDPMVLHYANNEFANVSLRKGLTFTIEPMVNTGSWRTRLEDDGWTVRTADKSLSAQFEHTVLVTEDGVEILTRSPAYGDKLPVLAGG